jgi:glycosyltransferase involved in cell wall biosynthesis
LRIAVLSRNFSSTGGGAERYAVALVEQLAKCHEVHVFTQSAAHQFPGVTYHAIALPMRRPRWINQLWFAYATWRATRKGFDIVHSHENTWHGNVQTVHVLPVKHNLFAGKSGFIRVLQWVKVCTSPRLLVYLWLERARYAVQPRRTVVVTSDTLRKVMEVSYPGARESLRVVVPGVAGVYGPIGLTEKLAMRQELKLPEEGRGLLFVGNDFQKKGLPSLLQALQGVPKDVWLAVVGQGEQDQAMRHLVVELSLSGRVYFLGALSNMDLAYRAVDCLVHPTLEDTYAMVVLEAMSHGLPVVVSGPQYCGIAAELADGTNAVLLREPQSAQEIGQAIGSVLKESTFAWALGDNARKFAARHTWEQVGQLHEQIYQRVAPPYRQRWLVLSHAFNMDGRAASQTITDKLPHLEAAGIELVVLSGVSGRQDRWYEHHQLWPAGPAGLRFELRHVLRKHVGQGAQYRTVMLLASLVLLPFMLIEKLLRPVESSWSWWLSAYLKGLLLLRARKFDLIYSTGGAFAAHVAGAALKRATGVRWLAEVHDPMVVPGAVPTTPQQKMQARVEVSICTHADVAIWFTDAALASAKRRNPQLGDRGHMMLPGVDAPPFPLEPYRPTDKFVIGHFGSLSETRNLSLVIAAMDRLIAEDPDLFGAMELHVYGGPLDSISAAAKSIAKHDFVRHFGRIETDPVTGKSGREQILQKMRQADVLLLLHGVEPICAEYIPSKMYEYLWMQRPILALVCQNMQLTRLLLSLGHKVHTTSVLADDIDMDALVVAIRSLRIQYSAGELGEAGSPSPYSTLKAVQQLLGWVN